MAPAQGMVSSQAITMLPATPQRTAESRRDEPTPITEPETTCVVLTGRPFKEAISRIVAAVVCAAKPLTGWSRKMRWPTVRTMGHQHGADQAPDEGMRGGAGQAQAPRDQVPRDGADQGRTHQGQRHGLRHHDALPDGGG